MTTVYTHSMVDLVHSMRGMHHFKHLKGREIEAINRTVIAFKKWKTRPCSYWQIRPNYSNVYVSTKIRREEEKYYLGAVKRHGMEPFGYCFGHSIRADHSGLPKFLKSHKGFPRGDEVCHVVWPCTLYEEDSTLLAIAFTCGVSCSICDAPAGRVFKSEYEDYPPPRKAKKGYSLRDLSLYPFWKDEYIFGRYNLSPLCERCETSFFKFRRKKDPFGYGSIWEKYSYEETADMWLAYLLTLGKRSPILNVA